jgi:hypothetical protein
VISAVKAQQAVLVHVTADHQRGRRAAEQAVKPVAAGEGQNRYGGAASSSVPVAVSGLCVTSATDWRPRCLPICSSSHDRCAAPASSPNPEAAR